jgi:nucleosome binding factor SPN SPT16 subunit
MCKLRIRISPFLPVTCYIPCSIQFIIDELKPGVVVAKVVEMAWERVKAMPNIPAEGSFRASFGSSIGVRCIDKASALKKDNQLVVAAGMAFSVVVGMSGINLSDAIPQTAMSKLASYSIVIADTVIIEAKGGKSVTEKLPSNRSSITYNLSEGDDDEEEAGDDSEKKHKVSTAVKDMSRIKGGRTETGRSARLAAKSTDTETDDAARKARQAKQLQLFNDQREKALKRLRGELDEDSGAAGGRHADDEIARAPEIEAYKSEHYLVFLLISASCNPILSIPLSLRSIQSFSDTSDYPKGGRACAISIDKSHDALLVPLFGTMVPFHVSTIKSIVKSDEGHKAFLRINFYSSNQSLGKDAAPSMAAAVLHHPDALYIRTLNFMSRDHRNFGMIEQVGAISCGCN